MNIFYPTGMSRIHHFKATIAAHPTVPKFWKYRRTNMAKKAFEVDVHEQFLHKYDVSVMYTSEILSPKPLHKPIYRIFEKYLVPGSVINARVFQTLTLKR